MQPPLWAALVFGVVCLGIGLVGWFVTNEPTGIHEAADVVRGRTASQGAPQ